MPGTPILRLEGVCKSFPGVRALDDVSMDVIPGEVHVLVGENGAGKSTLIKIISGIYRSDEGRIFFDGNLVELRSPVQARDLGISTVYQELTLAPYLSVAENIFMGRLPSYGSRSFVDWNLLSRKVRDLLDEVELDLEPKTLVAKLSVGYRQMVEIARALSVNARVMIFDEPTAVLTEDESSKLFQMIRKLKARSVGIIYISHRIAEVLEMADRITVLRDGRKIETLQGQAASYDQVVRLMVGRDIDKGTREKREIGRSTPLLEVRGLSRGKSVHNASFTLYTGEILGFYGLVGSGRTELARLLFGLDAADSGVITLEGVPAKIDGPRDAIRYGFGFLPEDRRHQGLVMKLSVSKNINLANHRHIQRWGFIRPGVERNTAETGVASLAIRTPSLDQVVENLSGGNQQKVIISRWLSREPRPRILILDEPTRGVDVGAKSEIHRLIRSLAEEGLAVMMISSDMPEVLSVSDRIMVMREGKIVGEVSHEEVSEQKLIFLAAH